MEALDSTQVDHPTTRAPSPHLLSPLSDIKLAHSVFALPFAILAAFLAAPRDPADAILWPTFAAQLTLIVLCMIFARTWAMLVNRLADQRFDAQNPRTAARALASGRARFHDALLLALVSAALFQATAAAFWPLFDNPYPALLATPLLAWIALYSFTKRFTALCHLFLGGALAASPIAAVVAIHPNAILTTTPPPYAITVFLLAGFVLLWVAGFDVAYALQDIDFDRQTGLRSIPAALGWRRALYAARAMHTAALTLLVAANLTDTRLGPLFAGATAGVALLLTYEHLILHRRGPRGIPLAFFTLNGIVSLTLGLLGAIDSIV